MVHPVSTLIPTLEAWRTFPTNPLNSAFRRRDLSPDMVGRDQKVAGCHTTKIVLQVLGLPGCKFGFEGIQHGLVGVDPLSGWLSDMFWEKTRVAFGLVSEASGLRRAPLVGLSSFPLSCPSNTVRFYPPKKQFTDHFSWNVPWSRGMKVNHFFQAILDSESQRGRQPIFIQRFSCVQQALQSSSPQTKDGRACHAPRSWNKDTGDA